MPRQKMSVEEFARQAVESVVSGNASSVVEEVTKLPKKQALVVVAYMVYLFPPGSVEVTRFLRMLEIQAS